MLGSPDLAPLARQVGLMVVGLALCGPCWMFGIEGHLMALLTVALLFVAVPIINSDRPSWCRCLASGILSGFVMLTRFDAAWFVDALVVFTF